MGAQPGETNHKLHGSQSVKRRVREGRTGVWRLRQLRWTEQSKRAPWTRSAVSRLSVRSGMQTEREERPWDRLGGAQQGGCRRRLRHPAPLLSEHPPSSHEDGPVALPWVGPACTETGCPGAWTRQEWGPMLLLAHPHQPPAPYGKDALRISSQEPGRHQGGERTSDATRNPGSSSAAPRHLGGWEASGRSYTAGGAASQPRRPLVLHAAADGSAVSRPPKETRHSRAAR